MARTREFDVTAAVDAAMSAFRHAGFAGTSIQDLVDATGVGRGSLYVAFGSKEGLYLAAMDRYRERFAEPLVQVIKDGAQVKELVREVLLGVVDTIVLDGNRDACMIVGSAVELAHRDSDVRDRLRDTVHPLENALLELVVRGQVSGEIPADRSADTIARFLVMTMHGLRVVGAIDPDRAALTAIAEMALDSLG